MGLSCSARPLRRLVMAGVLKPRHVPDKRRRRAEAIIASHGEGPTYPPVVRSAGGAIPIGTKAACS